MSHFLPIRKMNQLILRNKLSSMEVLESAHNRVKAIQHLNAFISHRKADSTSSCSTHCSNLLYSIPYALKDNYSSKDFSTTCASRILDQYQPTYDSTVLGKLANHGAVIIGKTNMDEFGMGSGSVDSVYQPVKNPWTPSILSQQSCYDDWNITGGSSGGSAVAVATGACTFALGSDTGGSIRNPASYCGVVGLKPTYGTISRHGLIPLVNSMDCPSIFARSVDDVAIVLDAIAGEDEMDATSVDRRWGELPRFDTDSLRGCRIGIPKECVVSEMTTDVIDTWRWAADQLEHAGAEVLEVSLPHMRYSIVCYHVLCAAEVASNMSRFDGLKYGHRCDVKESSDAMMALSRKEGFNDTVRSRILAGNYFLLKENRKRYFEQAQKVRRLICNDYKNVFGANSYVKDTDTQRNGVCDVLLTPTVLSDAPLYSDFVREDNRTRSAEQDVLTQSANIAGIPAIVVPTKLSSKKLPIGLQILGSHFCEPEILKVASCLEKLSNFPTLATQFSTMPTAG